MIFFSKICKILIFMIEYMLDVVNIKQKGWFYEYKEKNKEEK